MRRALALAGLLLVAAAPAGAHIITDREVTVLKALPEGLIRAAAGGEVATDVRPAPLPTPADAMRFHGMLLRMMDAAAREDSARAEAAWRAIEAASLEWSRTLLDSTRAPAERARALDVAVPWVGELCRTVLVIQNTKLVRKHVLIPLALYYPKLRAILEPYLKDAALAEQRHRGDAAMLMAYGETLLLGDGVFHEVPIANAGQRFLSATLGLQTPRGSFGATEPSLFEQAATLHRLQSIAIYFPAPFFDERLERGSKWLLGALKKKPSASAWKPPARPQYQGLARDASTRWTVLALAYHAQRASNGEARRALEKLMGEVRGRGAIGETARR